MQASGDPIEYLPIPKESQSFAVQAKNAIYNMVLGSHPAVDYTRHDLPDACLKIVEEVKKLYQEKMSLPGISAYYSHVLVLRKTFYAGGTWDTVIVPLVAVGDAKVYVRDKERGQVPIDWGWEKALFAAKETFFDIEKNKPIGAVFVSFPRRTQPH